MPSLFFVFVFVFYALFFLLGGIAVFIRPGYPRKRDNWFLTFFLISLAIWFSGAALSVSGMELSEPLVFRIIPFAFYCLGEIFIYFYTLLLVEIKFSFKIKHLIHGVSLFSFIILSLFFYKEYEVYKDYSFFKIYYLPPEKGFWFVIFYLSIFQFIFQMLILLYKAKKLWPEESKQGRILLRIQITSIYLNLFQSLLWLVDRIFSLHGLWYLYFLSGLFPIGAFFIVMFIPNYALIMQKRNETKSSKDLSKISYIKLRLESEQIKELSKKLNFYMESDKLYRNCMLSLTSLATRLSITPHQLSELLNVYFNKNFASLINGYRIEDAKFLLQNTEKNISEIAYDVGFSSIATFNRSFLKEVGMSARAFKSKVLQK